MGNFLCSGEVLGNGTSSRLRGRLISTVRPVSASTLATVMLSARRPVRSVSASPPISRMLNRPAFARVSPPPAKTLATRSRWAETIEAEATSPPTTVSTTARLMVANASRCRRASSGGRDSRQASSSRPAHPSAEQDEQHLHGAQHGTVGEHRDGAAA